MPNDCCTFMVLLYSIIVITSQFPSYLSFGIYIHISECAVLSQCLMYLKCILSLILLCKYHVNTTHNPICNIGSAV